MNQKLGTYSAQAMASFKALWACTTGSRKAAAMAVMTPIVADTGSSRRDRAP
ncbi:hypothetical protein QXH22_26815 [Mycobacterium sp. TY814]|nr:hypothetical protein [Mycobacterium sp. TY814]MDP7725884.1 hypothetical protein [Mycobacterium sp. TY814]